MTAPETYVTILQQYGTEFVIVLLSLLVMLTVFLFTRRRESDEQLIEAIQSLNASISKKPESASVKKATRKSGGGLRAIKKN